MAGKKAALNNDKWEELKERLKRSLTKGQFDLWIAPLHFLGIKSNSMSLGCRNNFHVQWIRERLESKIMNAVKSVFPEVKNLHYEVVADEPPLPSDNPEEEVDKETQEPDKYLGRSFYNSSPKPVYRQIAFQDVIRRSPVPFNPRFTFDHFVVGNCNQFAYASSMAIATGQSFHVPSLYLLADSGLGKSHLSHAVGNYIVRKNPRVKVRYVTAEQFANEMIAALKKDRMELFKEKYRNACDILLLERVEFLSGKEKIQSELIYTIDELLDRGKRIVCTGTKLPKDIPGLRDELKSRLAGVLLAPIEQPDFDTRFKILKKKAQLEGVKIPVKVLEYMAGAIEGDVRKLESCLIGLIAKSNVMNMPIDLSLARDVVETVYERLPQINISIIQDLVCETFKVDKRDLLSPSRKKEIALARKIAFYLCRQYTKETYQSIGMAFNRNHSTVIYAVKTVEKALDSGKGVIHKHVEYISKKLKAKCAI